MTRWEEKSAINPYWLAGRFFVEAYYDEGANHLYQDRKSPAIPGFLYFRRGLLLSTNKPDNRTLAVMV